jgi:plasmid stability protein
MATLTLHDVPEDLVARLEERAHAHGRSLTSEVLAALESLEPAAAGLQWLNLLQNL